VYALLERTWNPVEVKIEIAVLLFQVGADTAGVLLGARTVMKDEGRAAKVCKGEFPGAFITGGVPLVDFSMTGQC
jgi:hypothetical protein